MYFCQLSKRGSTAAKRPLPQACTSLIITYELNWNCQKSQQWILDMTVRPLPMTGRQNTFPNLAWDSLFSSLHIPMGPTDFKGCSVDLGHKRSAYLKQLQLLETALLGDKSRVKPCREQEGCLRGPGWAKLCEPSSIDKYLSSHFSCPSWLRISPQGKAKWESNTHAFWMNVYAYLCNCSNFSFL